MTFANPEDVRQKIPSFEVYNHHTGTFLHQLQEVHQKHARVCCDRICRRVYVLRVLSSPSKPVEKDCLQSFVPTPRLALERFPLFNTIKLAGLNLSRTSLIRPLLGTAFPVFCGTTTRPP